MTKIDSTFVLFPDQNPNRMDLLVKDTRSMKNIMRIVDTNFNDIYHSENYWWPVDKENEKTRLGSYVFF